MVRPACCDTAVVVLLPSRSRGWRWNRRRSEARFARRNQFLLFCVPLRLHS
jgi:hypothetical protein